MRRVVALQLEKGADDADGANGLVAERATASRAPVNGKDDVADRSRQRARVERATRRELVVEANQLTREPSAADDEADFTMALCADRLILRRNAHVVHRVKDPKNGPRQRRGPLAQRLFVAVLHCVVEQTEQHEEAQRGANLAIVKG